MISDNPILQPIFVGWVLGAFTSALKAYAPSYARKNVLKTGGSAEEAREVYEEEDARIYRLSKGHAAMGGWYLVAFILAVHGEYPQVAVTLSWALVFVFFILNLAQALGSMIMKHNHKSIFGFVLMPVSLIMIIVAVWFLIVAGKVILL